MTDKTPESFVKLFNDFAFIDIGLFLPAASCPCTVSEIPSDLKSMLKLADKAQAKLILKLNQGKPEIKHGVTDFDLTNILKYYDEEYADLKKTLEFIKTYFTGRKVDVAIGKGEDKEEGFEFDWVLVLDNKTLFSFVLNLQD